MPLYATKAQAKGLQKNAAKAGAKSPAQPKPKVGQLTLDGEVDEVEEEKKKRKKEEALHQAALMAHRKEMQAKHPRLRFLFATLNGLFMPPQIRARALEAGMAAGILDTFYMVRRMDPDGTVWSGLAMDLKVLSGGVASKDQREWAAHLIEQGWRVYFPVGCVEAWRILCCFEGITGADHIAKELIDQENMIRRICEIEGGSSWEAR